MEIPNFPLYPQVMALIEGNLRVVRDELSTGPGARAENRHNDIMLGIHDGGWHSIVRGGQQVTVPTRRFCVFWAMTPYQSIYFPPGTTSYYATVPLQWVLAWRLPPSLTTQLLQGVLLGSPSEQETHRDVQRFAAWHRLDREYGLEARTIILLEIEARLRLLVLEGPEPVAPQTAKMPGGPGGGLAGAQPELEPELDRVAVMARFIAEGYTGPITVTQVATAAGLHPNYAMGLFRRTCGFTVLNYVVQHRVWHAQRLLISTDLSLREISLGSGFGSEDRLFPVFARVCGCSPRQYRVLHRVKRVPV